MTTAHRETISVSAQSIRITMAAGTPTARIRPNSRRRDCTEARTVLSTASTAITIMMMGSLLIVKITSSPQLVTLPPRLSRVRAFTSGFTPSPSFSCCRTFIRAYSPRSFWSSRLLTPGAVSPQMNWNP